MRRQEIIEKIKEAAARDAKNRSDRRYKTAMAFMVRKGFLKSNMDFEKYYQAKLNLTDLIWAGKNAEPRILEVLPAAMVRLPKAFRINLKKETYDLAIVIKDLKEKALKGHDFLGIPYEKLKIWMEIPLKDKRTKVSSAKKKLATFRLHENTLFKIKSLADQQGISDAALIESLIQTYSEQNRVIDIQKGNHR